MKVIFHYIPFQERAKSLRLYVDKKGDLSSSRDTRKLRLSKVLSETIK